MRVTILSLLVFIAVSGAQGADEACPRLPEVLQRQLEPAAIDVKGGLAYLEPLLSADSGVAGAPPGYRVARAQKYPNSNRLLAYLKGYALRQQGCSELHLMLRPKHSGSGMVGSYVVPILRSDADRMLLEIPQVDDPGQHQMVRIRTLREGGVVRGMVIDVLFLPAPADGAESYPPEALDAIFGLEIEYKGR